MSQYRSVHQVRVLLSVLPDDPGLATGYGIDVRLMDSDTWETSATVAFGEPKDWEAALREATTTVGDRLVWMPRVLPFE